MGGADLGLSLGGNLGGERAQLEQRERERERAFGEREEKNRSCFQTRSPWRRRPKRRDPTSVSELIPDATKKFLSSRFRIPLLSFLIHLPKCHAIIDPKD